MLGHGLRDVVGNRAGDKCLEFAARQAPSGGIGPIGDQSFRGLVGVALAILDAVGGGQAVAGLIPEQPRERCRLCIGAAPPVLSEKLG